VRLLHRWGGVTQRSSVSLSIHVKAGRLGSEALLLDSLATAVPSFVLPSLSDPVVEDSCPSNGRLGDRGRGVICGTLLTCRTGQSRTLGFRTYVQWIAPSHTACLLPFVNHICNICSSLYVFVYSGKCMVRCLIIGIR
jgi:hypothetical protein